MSEGLLFEWGLRYRALVKPSFHLSLLDHEVLFITSGLAASRWKAPPSIKQPSNMRGCDFSLPIPSVSEKNCVRRAWIQALFRRFGKEAVALTLQIYGASATLNKLYMVARYKQKLADRLVEHPNLAPLFAVDETLWHDLDNWRIIKSRLLAQGLLPSTWRWLTHQSKAYIARVQWNVLTHLLWVNVQAQMQRNLYLPWIDKQTLGFRGFGGATAWLRRNGGDLSNTAGRQYLRVLRLCLDRILFTPNHTNLNELVKEEFPLINDWVLANLNDLTSGKGLINRQWTYDTLVMKQAHWHLSDWNSRNNQNVFWIEYLGEGVLSEGVEFKELVSLHALLQESRKMHHCVPSYIDRCVDGEIALFHLYVPLPKYERATLELGKCHLDGWKINQIKGPCNAPASEMMWRAANQLVGLLT